MPNCALCGEPMPPGEEMFKYHGFSGDCPKPPLPQPRVGAVIEYLLRDEGDKFWIDVRADRSPHGTLGPFASESERQRALDDLMQMVRSTGGQDLPSKQQ